MIDSIRARACAFRYKYMRTLQNIFLQVKNKWYDMPIQLLYKMNATNAKVTTNLSKLKIKFQGKRNSNILTQLQNV